MRNYRIVVGLAGLLSVALTATPAALAAGARVTLSRDGAKLNAEDTRMLEGAITQALEKREEGAVTSWENSATGNAGKATVTRIYTRKSQSCGTVEHVFTKGGGNGNKYILPYCQQPDGAWKVQY